MILFPQLIAIDGKEVRGYYDREAGTTALHLVSAWSTESQLVLAQTKVQSKSNEITAIPMLLDVLDIEGSIITIDAMGTHKKIADKIHQAGGDYILSLKANHPTLHWVLDVTFNEDACRVRSLHAPHNLSLVRRFALNILNCEHTFKGSLKQKSKRAAMDNRYMLTLLASAFAPSTTTS